MNGKGERKNLNKDRFERGERNKTDTFYRGKGWKGKIARWDPLSTAEKQSENGGGTRGVLHAPPGRKSNS